MRDIRIPGISNQIRTLLLALSVPARLVVAQELPSDNAHLVSQRFAYRLEGAAHATAFGNDFFGEDNFVLAIAPNIAGRDAFGEDLYRSDFLRLSSEWEASQPRRIAESPAPAYRPRERPIRRVFAPAPPPSQPLPIGSAVFLLAMLSVGGRLAWTLRRERSFRTVEQTEEELGLTVLSSVPKAKSRPDLRGRLIVQDLDSSVAESFRSLRAALSLGRESPGPQVTLFTSAVPGEGKTFCTANYAVSLAQLGERTLVIDGDLRRPTLHKYFFEEAPEEGLGPVLRGQCDLNHAIQASGIPYLFVLPAGHLQRQPAECFAQGAFHDLIHEAAEKFDRIVVDSAPLHAVSDALLMLPDVQAVCLVVRVGKTSQQIVKRALRSIGRADGAIPGVVLNGLRTLRADYFHHGRADYAKGIYGVAGNVEN